MINTFSVFKIVLGLVAAGFILAAAIQIASTYSVSQQGFRGAASIAALLKAAADVRATENPTALTGLPSFSYDGSEISAGPNTFPVTFPFLLVPGPFLFLDSQKLDLSWWVFRSASATPGRTIAFAFSSADPSLLETADSLAAALPNSQSFQPKTTFALCTSSLSAPLCGEPCEREAFRSQTLSTIIPGPCTASLPANTILVTFAERCPAASALCIQPPTNGITPVLLSGTEFPAKDPLDLAALALGGEPLFAAKNSHFSRELSLASRSRAAQARLLATRLESAVASSDLAAESSSAACIPLYRSFAAALDPLPGLLSQPATSRPAAAAVVSALSTIQQKHQDLKDGGCPL